MYSTNHYTCSTCMVLLARSWERFPGINPRVKGPVGLYGTVPRRAEPGNTLFIMDHYDIEGARVPYEMREMVCGRVRSITVHTVRSLNS